MNSSFSHWKAKFVAVAQWLRLQIDEKRIRETTVAAIPHLVAAGLVGLIAVVYAKLFLFTERFIFARYTEHPWAVFAIAPMAFLLAWYLVVRFAPAAAGSGIPQLMASAEIAEKDEGRRVNEFLGVHVFVIKILSSCVLTLGGGAIGREGPTLQLAGSTFYLTHQFLRRTLSRYIPVASLQSMIITGGAAGLAAAFNTPLGGIVYAIEELAKVHLSYFRTSLIQAVIVSGLVAQVTLGPYLYLGLPNVQSADVGQLPMAIVLCAIIGFLGACAGKSLFSLSIWRSSRKTLFQQGLVTVFFGCAFAALIYFFGLIGLGSGKDMIGDLLFSNRQAEWTWPLVRFLGNLFSYASGAAGGVFAPALATGASLGSVMSRFLPGLDPHLLILLGMVSFLTGVTRTPFTSFVLVLEMTDRHSVIFSMMIGAMSANAAAYLVEEHSLYEKMAKRFLATAQEGTPK